MYSDWVIIVLVLLIKFWLIPVLDSIVSLVSNKEEIL